MFACLGAVSVIWIGFPTYIKNYLDHGTFTYPLTGSGIDIITENSPRGFQGKGSIYKLFYGIFGRLSNVAFKAKEALPALKIPFSVSKSEFAFLGIDMRISGLGFFFSGILIVSAAICLGYLMFSRDGKNDKVYFGMNLLTAIGLVLGVPHSWWARYAPCLYLVPFVAVVIVTKQQSRKKWLSKLYGIFILAVIINNIYFIRQPAAVIKMSGQFSEELSRLSGKEINLAGNIVFSGKLFDFEDAGVLCHFKDEIAEPEGTCYYEPWEYVKQD